jgi:predicted nucleic acid-binding protein
MLAGLLFAKDDADDRPETLTATLPFGGGTLIEYQARLLIAAGAVQIVVAVTRATPELVGAVNRIARRGVAIDVVRTAAEALEKTHPLATIVTLADGLITTDAIIAALADGEGDAVLAIDSVEPLDGFERLDSRTLWGGVARISPRRLAEAARLPEEYDLQSTLLRVVAQAQPAIVDLPADALRQGHGIERDSRELVRRSRRALGVRLAARRPWVERFLLEPIDRWLLPPLADRGVPSGAVAAGSGLLALAGLISLVLRWPTTGLILEFCALVGLDLGQALCWMRGDDRPARRYDWGAKLVVALTVLMLGIVISRDAGTATGWLAAAALLVAGTLGERAAQPATRRRWWGHPAAYLLLLTIAGIAGVPLAGMIVSAAYAAASLASAIEDLRAKP